MELLSNGVWFKLASRSSNSNLERTSVVAGVRKVIPARSLWVFFLFLFSLLFFPPSSFFLFSKKDIYTGRQGWDCLCNSQEIVEFQSPFKVLLKDLGCRTRYTSKHAYYTRTCTRVRMHSGRPAFSQPLNTSKAHLSVERQALCHMLALQKSDIRGLSRDRATVSQTITAVIYVCHPLIHPFGDGF